MRVTYFALGLGSTRPSFRQAANRVGGDTGCDEPGQHIGDAFGKASGVDGTGEGRRFPKTGSHAM